MCFQARLAQSAERKALNLVVVGSNPTVGVTVGGISRRSEKAENGRWKLKKKRKNNGGGNPLGNGGGGRVFF